MPLSAVSAGPSLAQAFVAAAEVVGRVLDGESLNTALGDLKHRAPWQAVIAAAQDLCYNALRGYGVVDVALDRLLERPLTDSRLRGLLLAAFAELAARPQAAHAVVHQAVEAAVLLGHSRAKGLVNAVLRNFQRRMHQLLPEIEATEPGRYRHPQWWIDALRAAHPHGWEAALLDSNRHPPMVLRVNRRRRGLRAGRGRAAGGTASGCSRRDARPRCLRRAGRKNRTPARARPVRVAGGGRGRRAGAAYRRKSFPAGAHCKNRGRRLPRSGELQRRQDVRPDSPGCALLGVGRGATPPRHPVAAPEGRRVRVRRHSGAAARGVVAGARGRW